MSIFSRIQKLVEANINDLLDKVEEPEAKVNQLIRDLENALIDLRQNLASAMAAQKVSEYHQREIQEEATEWKANAKLALKNGEEALARKALEKKIYYEGRLEHAANQVANDQDLAERLQAELKTLEDKVSEARVKRETLLMKKQSSLNRSEILNNQEAIHRKVDQANQMMDHEGVLGEFEKDLVHQEAMASAREEILDASKEADFEAKIQQMKKDQALDDELAALKAELESED